jgi:hypothetical protein
LITADINLNNKDLNVNDNEKVINNFLFDNNEHLESLNSVNQNIHTSCKCECTCRNICICEITCMQATSDTASQINKYIETCINELHDETDSKNATIPFLPHLKSFLPEFRRLILHLHAVKGHANFRNIMLEIKSGHLDDDPELAKYSKEEIEGIKYLTSYVGHQTFSCIDCQMAKLRAKAHHHPKSSSLPPFPEGPFATGFMDIYGPFPVGANKTKYALVYYDRQTGMASISPMADK